MSLTRHQSSLSDPAERSMFDSAMSGKVIRLTPSQAAGGSSFSERKEITVAAHSVLHAFVCRRSSERLALHAFVC